MRYVYGLVCAGLLFSGCSVRDMAVDAGKSYIKEQKLGEQVTYLCYDLINKKDCPSSLHQADINLVPTIPFESRFCFGFSKEVVTPDGMYCVHINLIKD